MTTYAGTTQKPNLSVATEDFLVEADFEYECLRWTLAFRSPSVTQSGITKSVEEFMRLPIISHIEKRTITYGFMHFVPNKHGDVELWVKASPESNVPAITFTAYGHIRNPVRSHDKTVPVLMEHVWKSYVDNRTS